MENYDAATATKTFVVAADEVAPPAETDDDAADETTGSPFTDVAETDAFYDAVVWASENGYVNGVGGGRFNPAGSLTRADFATVLYRYAGSPEVEIGERFTDVPSGQYYSAPIAWAVEKKITNGTGETTFSPKNELTLWQLDVMLQRFGLGTDQGITSTAPSVTAKRSDIVVALKNFAEGKTTEYAPVSNTKIGAVIIGMTPTSAPAIIDGEYKTLTIENAAYGNAATDMFLIKSPGVYELTFNDAGVVTKIATNWDKVDAGYTIAPAKDGKITLGVKDVVFNVAEGATAYNIRGNATTYKVAITEIPTDKAAAYWAVLDDAGAVKELYFQAGVMQAAGLAVYDNAKKFDSAWGPADEATGLKNEYLYFKPEAKDDTKFPLVIWLHGSGFAENTWAPILSNGAMNPNEIANWASEDYQKQFTAGGAYIMAPRANADLGIGLRWGNEQVGSLLAAIDDFIAQNDDIDTDKIYIGGFSIGGGMTWLMLQGRADFFAAAFPAAPVDRHLPAADKIAEFATTPIWSIYGEGDMTVPYGVQIPKLDALHAAAKEAGVDSRLTVLGKGFTLPNGTAAAQDHCEWALSLNNMKLNDGTLVKDKDGVAVESTLIEWLNEQSK